MAEEAAHRRKVYTRRAHRSAATRFIDQSDAAIESADIRKLRQLKQSLANKLDVLAKLDEEMLLLVDENELESEVEQADQVRERIELAVLSIGDALRSLDPKRRSPSPVESRHRTSSDSSVSGEEEEDRSRGGSEESAATAPTTTTSISVVTAATTTPTTTTVSLPLISTSGQFLSGVSAHVTGTLTTPALSGVLTTPAMYPSTLPTSGLFPVSATYSGAPLSAGASLPSGAPLSSGVLPLPPAGIHSLSGGPVSTPMLPHGSVVTPSPAHAVGPQVRLPKLTIKKFNGDLTKWVTFWDSFNSSIHSNPSLSSVDKFNYLMSLVESSAAEALAGLTITSANYDEAIATLRKRFGNSQLIVNRHMEALLSVSAVSHLDLKNLRKLLDTVEAHVRGLRALGVAADSYGGLLTSILMNKLPQEIRLIVSREMTTSRWDLDGVMKILEREVEARERASTSGATTNPRRPPNRTPTGATLLTGSGSVPNCVYCGQGHTSSSCTSVTDVAARKDILRKAGRCFICLKKNHRSRECRSNYICRICRGKHHVSLCFRRGSSDQQPSSHSDGTGTNETPTRKGETPTQGGPGGSTPTSTMYAGAHTPVLLQTAQMQLFNPASVTETVAARAVFDCGSQRTYVTSRLREQLNLPVLKTEFMQIKIFGTTESQSTSCDVVELGVNTEEYGTLMLRALVIPFICNPLTSQPIDCSQQSFDHLVGLNLADSANVSDVLEIDVLIGSDAYWDIVTGQIVRGECGPTAIQTKVGWILSGPATHSEFAVNLTLASTHTLKVDACPSAEPALDDCLKRFWDLESLGVVSEETSVYEKFVQKIRFDGHRYEVSLPWKECHPPLPDHRDLCRKRLMSLLRRLRQTPQLLLEYDAIIRDQLEKGVVEVVTQPALTVSDRIHYLPHHGIVRQDKTTSKLRIVYDASARSSGPSLNDCLYTGPKFGQSIFDILVRFRLHKIALIGDIEKAFLMVSVQEEDRDSLRFLWVADLTSEPPELITLRFTRVVFGVSASPFLLNATVNHHMNTYRELDSIFVDKFLSSIYVDDVVSGSYDVESTFEFYQRARRRLAAAGFRLRKFVTNSEELSMFIQRHESELAGGGMGQSELADGGVGQAAAEVSHVEDDQSYAKISLGIKVVEEQGLHKVLGIQWNATCDTFQFDIGEVTRVMENSEPTKRNVVSAAARFFDPLGIVSPITVSFKMFSQELCEAKVNWDDVLTGPLLEKWKCLLSMLQGSKPIVIPRCVCDVTFRSARLVGFCDASLKAYAAVVYLRTQDEVSVQFIAAKTRVTPVGGMTIPRLELLSALLLSKLIASVQSALEPELVLGSPVCFTDSMVALYWIQGTSHQWKQFVENRVSTIRSLVEPQCWRHCPGRENPADIPSRGMSALELSEASLWLDGPEWLQLSDDLSEESVPICSVPEECESEMKRRESIHHSLVTIQDPSAPKIGQLIDIQKYSSLFRLFRVTALVLKFIHCLRGRATSVHSVMSDAKLLWIRECQSQVSNNSKFVSWKLHLQLYQDESGIWRCGGRLAKSCLSLSAKNPILLDKGQYLTRLIVMNAHLRVLHNGVKETLAQLRSEYWLVKGRQFVRKLIHGCVVCKKMEGKPCRANPPPPLPEYRVQPSRPFLTTGVDFAGPFFVRSSVGERASKVWLCLYTCCATRAVHLDLVCDMTATTFVRSFRRFSARRGTPSRVISDNGKTFKSASKLIRRLLESSEAVKYFSQLQVDWQFNLERAPWWGGIFERMIKSAKRCLRKSIGRRHLFYDELLTLVVEVEAVLNSRPLTYVSADDVDEPLTPSHLLVGYRILTLPDPPVPDDDPDYSPDGVTRRMSHLSKALGHFWSRWKREYLLELREFHRTREERGTKYVVNEGDVVTVYDDGHPRGLWRLGKIEHLVRGSDGVVRGVHVKVMSKKGCSKTIRRPLQHIFPLEVCGSPTTGNSVSSLPNQDVALGRPHDSAAGGSSAEMSTTSDSPVTRRPVRRAAMHAHDRILGCIAGD